MCGGILSGGAEEVGADEARIEALEGVDCEADYVAWVNSFHFLHHIFMRDWLFGGAILLLIVNATAVRIVTKIIASRDLVSRRGTGWSHLFRGGSVWAHNFFTIAGLIVFPFCAPTAC